MVKQLIEEHFDLWSEAHTTKSTSGRGSSSKLDLHGIKKLRELILELAVRGKLVPQNPDDEPASVLLQRIAVEKAQLVKEKKIKKQKPLSPIAENEKPFLLPDGWEWARLGEIGRDWGQKTPSGDFTYLDVSAIDNSKGKIASPKVLPADKAPSRARKKVAKGTVIYSTVRPYLQNICVVDRLFTPEAIASTAFAILHPLQQMSGEFFALYLRSPVFIKYVESVQTGIAYPAINDKQFFSGLTPVPPHAEALRIMDKVNELLALCDQLEQQQTNNITAHQTLVDALLATLTQSTTAEEVTENWTRIAEHFDTLFTTDHSIEQLKQTVLQLAVMGRLVPQDDSDEPASVLLEKIAEEKARLVKEKKIKKQRPLPAITDEEKPFPLPKGWEWCRVGTFTVVGTGATPARDNPEYYEPAEIPWVTSGETGKDFIESTQEKVSSLAVKETNVSVYPIGTLIVAMYGQGKTRGQVSELKIDAGTNQACAAIQFVESSVEHRKYVKLFFQKSYEDLRTLAAGGAQPNLNVGKISNTVVALPPLSEKCRIVTKVHELMELCDTLKSQIHQTQTTQLNLANAIVEKAVTNPNHHIEKVA